MKYVALLRGINVGGNSMVKMAALKEVFVQAGFTEVSTFINSGNVLFSSEDKNGETITNHIESILTKNFFPIKVVVLPEHDLKKVLQKVPREWDTNTDLRCYISFIKPPMTPQDALPLIDVKEDVDVASIGPGVIYMSTKLGGLTKSGFTKLIGKKIYQSMTMRNYTTVKKLLNLVEMHL